MIVKVVIIATVLIKEITAMMQAIKIIKHLEMDSFDLKSFRNGDFILSQSFFFSPSLFLLEFFLYPLL